MKSPNHHAPKAARHSKLTLLHQCLIIVVGNPLVIIPVDLLNSSLFVVCQLEFLVVDNVKDLLEIQDT